MGITPEQARTMGIPVDALRPTAASRDLARKMGLQHPGKEEMRVQHRETVEDRPRNPEASEASEKGRAARGRGDQAELEVLEACRWLMSGRISLT